MATYKKDKSRFDDVVKVLVENKRGGNDYKSVLEILNIYQAVGDMHFIGERDYFNKIEKKLEKELETRNCRLNEWIRMVHDCKNRLP